MDTIHLMDLHQKITNSQRLLSQKKFQNHLSTELKNELEKIRTIKVFEKLSVTKLVLSLIIV